MRRAFLALLLALPLAACDSPDAPAQTGVCWRLHRDAVGQVSFAPLERNVGSLETCAVLLEARRLNGETGTDGAYQGYFVFAEGAGISSAQRLQGFRFPIFQPPQRAAVDRDLLRVMRENGGRPPTSTEITIERNN
jgi:hypothetical protein